MACWGIASYIAKHKNLPSFPLYLEYYIPLFTVSDTSELKPALGIFISGHFPFHLSPFPDYR